MPLAPPTLTPLSTPPTTADPVNFDPRMDAFLSGLPPLQTEQNALAANVYANALEVKTYADDVYINTVATASNAAQAAQYAGAAVWASGTYAQYAVAFSPATKRVYRKTSASGGVMATDPSLDTTNWTQANASIFYESVTAATKNVVSGGAYAATGGTKTRFILPTLVNGNPAIVFKPANELETNEIDPGAAAIEGNTGILVLDNPFRTYTLQPINGKWRFA